MSRARGPRQIQRGCGRVGWEAASGRVERFGTAQTSSRGQRGERLAVVGVERGIDDKIRGGWRRRPMVRTSAGRRRRSGCRMINRLENEKAGASELEVPK